MNIFKSNSKEELTAKDSKIQELEATVSQLRQELTKTLNNYSELLRENKKLLHDFTMLKIELKGFSSDEEKKTINLNNLYSGIQEY